MSSSDFFYNSPTVEVIVGAKGEARTFYIHKTLAMNYSKYFATSLSSNFIEGKIGAVILDEDDPTAFDAFAQWLYAREYDISRKRNWLTKKNYKLLGICFMPKRMHLETSLLQMTSRGR
jgi:hypothetical protein